MAGQTIGVQPYLLKNLVVKFEDNDYSAAIPSCLLTPTQQLQTWKGGTPDAVFSDLSDPVWQCQMKLAQDFNNAQSLYNYLLSHRGQPKPFQFIPVDTEGPSLGVSATLVIAAPPFGGDIDSWAEVTLTHGVIGQPVFAMG